MSLSKCWKWIMEFMQTLFQTSSPSPPPVELCNDILFEIFLRLPPEVLPRFSNLNKQSNNIINSPLFQTTYWGHKLRLPRLYAMVYYQRKLNNRIGFALTIKEYDQSHYTRLLQWAESMLQYHETGPNGVNIHRATEKPKAQNRDHGAGS
ncbi:F-box-like domain superfamily [Sesbania bispinosa]|nr:F-box-like domain superfamily [Sesbania bispinosa]